MRKAKGAKSILSIPLRLLGAVLAAAMCLVLSTGARIPEGERVTGKLIIHSEPAALKAAATTPPPEPEYFELSFVGDCTLASSEYNKALSSSYESVVGQNYAYPFALTRQYFAEDDFTFANFECVLTSQSDAKDKNFTFRAEPAYVNILTEGSVEFVTLGNNHSMDYGEEGYAETKAILEGAGIGYAGRDEYSLYETASGLKIGVYAVSFGESPQITAGVAALRELGAEFIIAAIHWGDEGSYDANQLQREQARAAVDAGAHFVYGSHPHTLQPREEYNGVPIYYSMGNWSFGGNTAPRDPDTIILKMTVKKDWSGAVSVTGEKVIPCACTGTPGANNYQPAPYAEGSEEYNRTLSKIDGTFEGPNLSINYQYSIDEYY